MNRDTMIRAALYNIVEGRESLIFDKIKEDIEYFFETYNADNKLLTSSQAAMIHEIFMSGDENTIFKRLDDYKELQLNRTSEKNKWQKEVNSEKAINYFYGMIHGLLKKYSQQINEELKERFYLEIDVPDDSLVYQYLIKTFDYIFITQLRISKEVEQNV